MSGLHLTLNQYYVPSMTCPHHDHLPREVWSRRARFAIFERQAFLLTIGDFTGKASAARTHRSIASAGRSPRATINPPARGGGDRAAFDSLVPLVHGELKGMARHYMLRERAGNSLQTTGLVNEAYIRLVEAEGVDWQDRAHFFAVSGR